MANKELTSEQKIEILRDKENKTVNKILKLESKYANIHRKCVSVAKKGRRAFFTDAKLSVENFMQFPWNAVEDIGVFMAILATPIMPFTFLTGLLIKAALAIPTEIMYHKYKGKDEYDAGYEKFRNKFVNKRVNLTKEYDKVREELTKLEMSLEEAEQPEQLEEVENVQEAEILEPEMETTKQVEITEKPSRPTNKNNKETEMAE